MAPSLRIRDYDGGAQSAMHDHTWDGRCRPWGRRHRVIRSIARVLATGRSGNQLVHTAPAGIRVAQRSTQGTKKRLPSVVPARADPRKTWGHQLEQNEKYPRRGDRRSWGRAAGAGSCTPTSMPTSLLMARTYGSMCSSP